VTALVAGIGSMPHPRTGALTAPPRRPVAVRPFTALVVATEATVRGSLASRLRAMGGVDVGEAASATEARAIARGSRPRNLCLLDLDLPDGRGLDLLAELRGGGWRRIVVLSPEGDVARVHAAFAAGAQGLLLVASPEHLLEAALQRSGSRELSSAPAPVRTWRGVSELSGRELQVLELVASGRSNKEVGAELHLSALTVKSHLARIARKLGTGDRAEMVALALRAGAIR
jgi:DNA-binding NarL/FixJ family response regulator